MECAICPSAQLFRREGPQGDGSGGGPSMHLAQTDSDMQYVDWGSLLVDSADSSAAVVIFMAAGYLSAAACSLLFLTFRGPVYPMMNERLNNGQH
eukprot:6010142-Pyramimonas_sp.AAC.1